VEGAQAAVLEQRSPRVTGRHETACLSQRRGAV